MAGQIDLRAAVRNIPDFPKKGIVFRDITTLLKDKDAFAATIELIGERYKGAAISKVVSVEARGFIFGSALAYALGAGFVPVRKPGKLPAETIREAYALEYGTDALEIHVDAISPGDLILLVDDLLATGGTILAACDLVRRLGGKIHGLAFLIELSFLHGRERLREYDVFSLIQYQSE